MYRGIGSFLLSCGSVDAILSFGVGEKKGTQFFLDIGGRF